VNFGKGNKNKERLCIAEMENEDYAKYEVKVSVKHYCLYYLVHENLYYHVKFVVNAFSVVAW